MAYLRLQDFGCARLLSCFALPFVDLPEDCPEFLLTRVKFRISRNNCPAVRPISFILHQLSPYRIGQDIRTRLAKGVSLTLLRPKHTVVWLMLPLTLVAQSGLKVYAQELHCVELVTPLAQSHPNQVKMIRHQAVGRTKQVVTRSGMKHQLAEACMKTRVEPSLYPMLERQCPEDNRVPTVELSLQARKLSFLFRVHVPRSSHRIVLEGSTSLRRWLQSSIVLERSTKHITWPAHLTRLKILAVTALR